MTATMAALDEQLDLLYAGDPEAIQDPYPLFKRLRDEAPVHLFGSHIAFVSRYEDVKECLRDSERFLQAPSELWFPFENARRLLSQEDERMLDEVYDFEALFLTRMNGETHRRARAAAHRYFTAARIAGLESTFQTIFDELVEEHRDEEAFDFTRIAYRFPLLVITEVLGVPREDADMFKAWGDDLAAISRNPIEPEVARAKWRAVQHNKEYIHELFERHRRSPERTELVASVLDAREGDRLSEEELIALCVMIGLAGHETTTALIGMGLNAFMRNRDQWQLLCEDPSLIDRAVEEVLRYEPPVQEFPKLVGRDVEIAGVPVPAGRTVLMVIAAANRDPDAFEDPDAFDIRRQPNDHVTLGFGPHYCLGQALARIETKIAFRTLARRFPDVELAVDPGSINHLKGIRRIESLPVRLGCDRDR
jgi:cytochrome P450